MAVVLIINEQNKQSKFKLPYSTVVLGRSAKADLRIADDKMSGTHCEISLSRNNILQLTDLGSTNGTYVNGSKQSAIRIFVGDEIILGNTQLQISQSDLNIKERKDLHNLEKTNIRYIEAAPEESTDHEPAASRTSSSVSHKSNSGIALNFGEESSEPSLRGNQTGDAPNPSSDESFKINSSLELKAVQNDETTTKTSAKKFKQPLDIVDMLEGGYVASGATKLIKLDKDALIMQKKKSQRTHGGKSTLIKDISPKERKKKKKKKPKTLIQKLISFFK